ncbi:MAG: hypothetical protein KF862_16655 [Chitinophagaceae bacterium]|nr:hypothetical protein [Chitinophagaceae bacterium]
MKSSTYEFKQKLKNKGFSGRITLNVKRIEANSVSIIYKEFIDRRWKYAIEFAAQHFHEVVLEESNGLHIEVEDLSTHVIDSGQIVLFYITLNCLCDCFGIPHLVRLDEVNATFILDLIPPIVPNLDIGNE